MSGVWCFRVYIIPVWGMVIRWIFLEFTLYSVYLATGMGVQVGNMWHPASGEKTESQFLTVFIRVMVILSIWLPGAIPASILCIFPGPGFRNLNIGMMHNHFAGRYAKV